MSRQGRFGSVGSVGGECARTTNAAAHVDPGIRMLWAAMLDRAVHDLSICNGRPDCPRQSALWWLRSESAEAIAHWLEVDVVRYRKLPDCRHENMRPEMRRKPLVAKAGRL